ncbi:hypothetical protein AJ79_04060 [Helicocarpus griseus UAMH5409]|uniref:Serine-threonine/tyrosine-protein kinase catalytic domain-containing protein n=1 Tax=Helicocarpus griseus UAMH5409 TaxID=1447875 RepID=A0A2B7XUE8_9EURO|nr:hypothetical protein AJ79_04060 [Helicocarpus griseus UAMH5409]
MRTADDAGYPIYTDIGQLGAVMYEIVTGVQCRFDLFEGLSPGPEIARWPSRKGLPSTEGIWLGSIIERCWIRGDGGFRDSGELAALLELVSSKGSAGDNHEDATSFPSNPGLQERNGEVLRSN